MGNKERDGWDKADVLFKAVGSVLTPLAIAYLGVFGNQFLKSREESEAKIRLYSELMSRREESESALRKDMFKSIIESFLDPKSSSLKEKVLNLELLSYNFHESLNLKPLFMYLNKQINSKIDTIEKNKRPQHMQVFVNIPNESGEESLDTLYEYLDRLDKVAREISKKQSYILEQVGQKFDRTIELKSLTKNHGGPSILLEEATLKLNNIERRFRINVLEDDPKNKRIKVRLWIDTPSLQSFTNTQLPAMKLWAGKSLRKAPTHFNTLTQFKEFWVGFFDFPIIDNTRLSNDERCAIVLTEYDVKESIAEITVVYFPGAYASLKEKPYYEEI